MTEGCSLYHFQLYLGFCERLHLDIKISCDQFTFFYIILLECFCFCIISKASFHRVMVSYIHAILYWNYNIIFYKYVSLFVIAIYYLSIEPSWLMGHVYILIFRYF